MTKPIRIEADGHTYELELADVKCNDGPMGNNNDKLVTFTVKVSRSMGESFKQALIKHLFHGTPVPKEIIT